MQKSFTQGTKRQTITDLESYAKIAIQNGYYFEALWIYFALIDDRVQSLLFHASAPAKINDRDTANLRFRSSARKITKTSIVMLGKKINIWRLCNNVSSSLGDYPVLVDPIFSKSDIESLIVELENWLETRNNLMHSLPYIEDGIATSYTKLLPYVKKGESIFNQIRKYTNRVRGRAKKQRLSGSKRRHLNRKVDYQNLTFDIIP